MNSVFILFAVLLTNVLEVTRTVDRLHPTDNTFEITGQVSFFYKPNKNESDGRPAFGGRLALEDHTGITGLFFDSQTELPAFQPGDTITACGYFRDNVVPQPFIRSLTRLKRGTPPTDLAFSIDKMLNGELNWRSVCLQGILKDVVHSDLSPDRTLLRIHCQGYSLLGTVIAETNAYMSLRGAIGATITTKAICAPWDGSLRNRIGHVFWIESPQAISLHTASGDPFGVPPITSIKSLHPESMLGLGRHRTRGRVIAVWQNQYALLRDDDGQIANCDFLDTPMPAFNSTIEVAGFPSSDLYHINLSHAIWRQISPPAFPPEHTEPIRFPFGDRQFANNHGRRLRLRGTVKSRPDEFSRFYLDAGPQILLIDVSSVPSLAGKCEIGSVIEASGTCVIDINHSPYNTTFPRISGGIFVVNRPEDVLILANPPWLTPKVIATSAAFSIALILAVFLWNYSLNRMTTKRKIAERTRLAIELHDSLSQNLTGVACQVAAARNALVSNPPAILSRLQTAEHMLNSCRSELANCLFDLRSDAIDDANLSSAIRKSLIHLLDDCSIFIRFHVNRASLPDTTAHTLLAIIRELATNAVRHGSADSLKIAGLTVNGRLSFSVSDNGSGFNPGHAPGPNDGHFGLQGIRDRLERIAGTMEIDSHPGRGTYVRVSVILRKPHG